MLRKACFLAAMLVGLAPVEANANLTVLEGRIGEREVHMVLHERNGVTRATYYDLADRTPVRIKPAFFSGREGGPAMDELDDEGLPRARIRLQDSWYLGTATTVAGTWTDYRTGRTVPIHLTRIDDGQGRPPVEAGPALLQAASDDTFYFRAQSDGSTGFIREIHVFAKATGQLSQRLVFDRNVCVHGIDSVTVRYDAGHRLLVIEDAGHCRGAVARWNRDLQRYDTLP